MSGNLSSSHSASSQSNGGPRLPNREASLLFAARVSAWSPSNPLNYDALLFLTLFSIRRTNMTEESFKRVCLERSSGTLDY